MFLSQGTLLQNCKHSRMRSYKIKQTNKQTNCKKCSYLPHTTTFFHDCNSFIYGQQFQDDFLRKVFADLCAVYKGLNWRFLVFQLVTSYASCLKFLGFWAGVWALKIGFENWSHKICLWCNFMERVIHLEELVLPMYTITSDYVARYVDSCVSHVAN